MTIIILKKYEQLSKATDDENFFPIKLAHTVLYCIYVLLNLYLPVGDFQNASKIYVVHLFGYSKVYVMHKSWLLRVSFVLGSNKIGSR